MKTKNKIIFVCLFVVILFTLRSLHTFSVDGQVDEYQEFQTSETEIAMLRQMVVLEEETKGTYDLKTEEMNTKLSEIESIKEENTLEWFVQYKEIIDEYSEFFDKPETIYDYYTEDEIYLMQRCIETEVYQCDFNSKVNVANVILNRLEHERFSDEVKKVIVRGQFAFGRTEISEDTKLALEYAFIFEDTTNGALFFHSNSKTNIFSGASYLFSDNAVHHFYGFNEDVN